MEEKETYLAKTSYRDYLLKNVGLSETSVKYFQGRSNDFSALGADALPAADAYAAGFPASTPSACRNPARRPRRKWTSRTSTISPTATPRWLGSWCAT